MKTTIELILQSTTTSSLEAAAAVNIRTILQQERRLGGKQPPKGKDSGGEKIHNPNPFDFSFKTLSHLAKVDEQVLNTKVRVGAPSHLLYDNKEHPLMYVAGQRERGATPVAAASPHETNYSGTTEVYEGATPNTLIHLQKYLFMKTNELVRVGHVATILGYGWVAAAERATSLAGFPSLNTSEVLSALEHGGAAKGPLFKEVGSRCVNLLPNHMNKDAPAPANAFAGNVPDVITAFHSMGPVPDQPDALFADDEILLAAAAAGVNVGEEVPSVSPQERQSGGGPSMKTETAARLQVSRMRGKMRRQAGGAGGGSTDPSPRTAARRRSLPNAAPQTGQTTSQSQPSIPEVELATLDAKRSTHAHPEFSESTSPLAAVGDSSSSSDDGIARPSTDFLLNKSNRRARKRLAREDYLSKKHAVIQASRLQYRPYEKRELLADKIRRERAVTPMGVLTGKVPLPMVPLSPLFDNEFLDRRRRGDVLTIEGRGADPCSQEESQPTEGLDGAPGDPEDDICWGLSAVEPGPDPTTGANIIPSQKSPHVVSDCVDDASRERITTLSRELYDLRRLLHAERLKSAALQREVGRSEAKSALFHTLERHLSDVHEISTLCELGCTSAAAVLLKDASCDRDIGDPHELLAAIRTEFSRLVGSVDRNVNSSSSILGTSIADSCTGRSEAESDAKPVTKRNSQVALVSSSTRPSLSLFSHQSLPTTTLIGERLRRAGGTNLALFSGSVFASILKEYPFGRLLSMRGQRQ